MPGSRSTRLSKVDVAGVSATIEAKQRCEQFVNLTLRYNSVQVEEKIPPDITRLYQHAHMDRQADVVEKETGELDNFLVAALRDPYSYLQRYPFHQDPAEMQSLRRELTIFGRNADNQKALRETARKWALPMLRKWSQRGLNTWLILLDNLELRELTSRDFQLCLFDYLFSYETTLRGDVNIPQLQFGADGLVEPLSASALKTSLRRQVTETSEKATTLRSSLEALGEETNIRSIQAKRLNNIIHMHSQSLFVDNVQKGKHHILSLSKATIALSRIEDLIRQYNGDEIRIEADVAIYLDCDLQGEGCHGKSLSFIAPRVEAVRSVKIDVSGRNNLSKPGEYTKRDRGTGDGEHGDHGMPGQSGGNITVTAFHFVGREMVEFIQAGGNGSDGGNGADGADGRNGSDGAKGNPTAPWFAFGGYCRIDEGKPGESGGKGGNGGGKGFGGEAGFGGDLVVEVMADKQPPESTTAAGGERGQDGTAGV